MELSKVDTSELQHLDYLIGFCTEAKKHFHTSQHNELDALIESVRHERSQLETELEDRQGEVRTLGERILHLEAELKDYEASFQLYDDAVRRGTAMWQEATGNTHIYPDTAKLVAWLLEEFQQLRTERDALVRYAGLLDRNINTFGLPLNVAREIGDARRALSEQTRKEIEDD